MKGSIQYLESHFLRLLSLPFLIVVTVVIILITGCVSPLPADKSTGNISETIMPQATVTILPVATSPSVECPQENNSSLGNISIYEKGPIIIFNPVPVQRTGYVINFSGTTNLPPGEKITFYLTGKSIFLRCNQKQDVGACANGQFTQPNVVIKPGNCGFNIWLWNFNTSQNKLYPDNCSLSAEYKNYSNLTNWGFVNIN